MALMRISVTGALKYLTGGCRSENHRRASATRLIVFVLVAASCGDRGIEDLKSPVFSWEQGNGLCSRFRVVDGNRSLWDDSGCESPVSLSFVREMSKTDYERLQMKSRALSEEPEGTMDCGPSTHRFRFAPASPAPAQSWSRCKASKLYGDLQGLSEPFLSIAEMLN